MTLQEQLDAERAAHGRTREAYFALVRQYADLQLSVTAAVPVLNGHMNELREALGQPKANLARCS